MVSKLLRKGKDLNQELLDTLELKLKVHDFTYWHSDDHRAYKKGLASSQDINKLVRELGVEGKILFREYEQRFYH